jgi:hypothetical protein
VCLIPQSRVFHEKLMVTQLVIKLCTFRRTLEFIRLLCPHVTATGTKPKPVETSPFPDTLFLVKLVVILPSCLGFLRYYSDQTFYIFLISPMSATYPNCHSLDFITLIIVYEILCYVILLNSSNLFNDSLLNTLGLYANIRMSKHSKQKVKL